MVVPVKFSCGFVANIWLEICFNTMSLRAKRIHGFMNDSNCIALDIRQGFS